MRIASIALLVSTSAFLAATAASLGAAPINVPAVMHARHEGMEQIGKAFKALNRELGGGSPDLAVVRASATTVSKLALQSGAWFPPGTGPNIAKTGARPEIWLPQNKADFAAKLHSFQIAAPAFQAAAAGNDVGAMKAKFAALGGTCKACHDKYRMDMHH